MPIQAIYFDLGNVLLGFSHERMCRQIADVAGISPESVLDIVFGNTRPPVSPRLAAKLASRHEAAIDQPPNRSAQWLYESGHIDTDTYYEYFCEATGTRPDPKKLIHAACDIFWPLDDMFALAQRLAASGLPLGILSNINEIHWQFVTDGRFPLLHEIGRPHSPFRWPVLSFEARSMKPERRIYDVAVAHTGAAVENVLFLDDRADNVAGAIAAGLDAIQFTNIESLRPEFERRGIRGVF